MLLCKWIPKITLQTLKSQGQYRMFEETSVFESFWINPAVSQLRKLPDIALATFQDSDLEAQHPKTWHSSWMAMAVMDHRTNRQFREICWGWFLGLWWLWWWLWWLWWWLWWLYISNRFKSDVFSFSSEIARYFKYTVNENPCSKDFKSTIQRLALWLAFNVRVSKLFAL